MAPTKQLENKFAKLFDLDNGHQLIAYLKYDPDEDVTNIVTVTSMGGICIEMKLGFSGENQEEKSQKALDKLDKNGAQKYYEAMEKVLLEA